MGEPRTVPQSALANDLLKRCVLGFMSPQEAQQIAAAAKADVAAAVDYVTGESDGFSFEGINRLAAIGRFRCASQPQFVLMGSGTARAAASLQLDKIMFAGSLLEIIVFRQS